jgi:23S rRNA (guanosine2251-2'-O)-methyltransferase
VVEALTQGLPVAKIHLADAAHGPEIDTIRRLARAAGVEVEQVTEARVTAIARTARHHQGVVADVEAARMSPLESFLQQRTGRRYATRVLVLDRVHNPSNVGMILRVAVAADLDGVVVPEVGTAEIGAVAIKASAGIAFRAPILRVGTAEDAVERLRAARFSVVGLTSGAPDLWDSHLPERAAFVLGNETDGLSPGVAERCTSLVSVPLANEVESLNVATAASVLAFELVRRKAAAAVPVDRGKGDGANGDGEQIAGKDGAGSDV